MRALVAGILLLACWCEVFAEGACSPGPTPGRAEVICDPVQAPWGALSIACLARSREIIFTLFPEKAGTQSMGYSVVLIAADAEAPVEVSAHRLQYGAVALDETQPGSLAIFAEVMLRAKRLIRFTFDGATYVYRAAEVINATGALSGLCRR